eukprot:9448836-Heterocapsa_arctica.AAC.1
MPAWHCRPHCVAAHDLLATCSAMNLSCSFACVQFSPAKLLLHVVSAPCTPPSSSYRPVHSAMNLSSYFSRQSSPSILSITTSSTTFAMGMYFPMCSIVLLLIQQAVVVVLKLQDDVIEVEHDSIDAFPEDLELGHPLHLTACQASQTSSPSSGSHPSKALLRVVVTGVHDPPVGLH